MSINKDQVKGRIRKAEGKLKEVVGILPGNESLEARGKRQEAEYSRRGAGAIR
jgi:uncharacterized protein YjbJ (UPF0337 family)